MAKVIKKRKRPQKLTDDQHQLIRNIAAAGHLTYREIAEMFNITTGAVGNIVYCYNNKRAKPRVPRKP